MRFLSPTPAKVIVTMLLFIILLPWYFFHLNTLFNPYHLPSCWDLLPNGSAPIPCASPFRSFTYGIPVALTGLLLLYFFTSFILTWFSAKKHKEFPKR